MPDEESKSDPILKTSMSLSTLNCSEGESSKKRLKNNPRTGEREISKTRLKTNQSTKDESRLTE